MEEIWKQVVGYEWSYEVSNLWNVRRSAYKHKQIHKTIRPFLSSKRYLQVHLYKQNKQKNYLVHRLVAMSFLGSDERRKFVNHKDWNKLNNSSENLERCTRSENIQHAIKKLGASVWYKPIKVVWTCISTGEEVHLDSLADWEKIGFSKPSISLCINGKRARHKGYIWSKV